jgi:hypothetical protein
MYDTAIVLASINPSRIINEYPGKSIPSNVK